MKLRHSPTSPFVRKVMVAAYELDLEPRIERIPTRVQPTQRNDEVVRDNPLVKIPALTTDDGFVIYDSPVICEYLDGLSGAPKLHPAEPKARLVALRRQALGDGFLDLLVLLRDERLRADPSDAHKASAAVRKAAVLKSLDAEAAALSAAPFGIGHIAIGCALSYLDFRYADEDWRKDHPRIAGWHASFAARPSVRATEPVDDS